ncbi:hypothetical protein [Mongoliimonas terrestris]|uniref:hypothetical protein n=1 Tax=Mongoliimonas terrestris TaxID=1709001 RepID=UPI0009497AF0|nr:hypothetical protein [Mongoliimonas terrestris]
MSVQPRLLRPRLLPPAVALGLAGCQGSGMAAGVTVPVEVLLAAAFVALAIAPILVRKLAGRPRPDRRAREAASAPSDRGSGGENRHGSRSSDRQSDAHEDGGDD